MTIFHLRSCIWLVLAFILSCRVLPAQERTTDQAATRQALQMHTEAGAIDALPRFSHQARYRHGIVDSMRAIDVSLDLLKEGLDAPVRDMDWLGWYQTGFSWDEQRFLCEMSPGDTVLHYDARFWTATDAWERREANDKSSINFVRASGPAQFWKTLHLFDYSYLRFTPHRFWWGQMVHPDQSMSLIPPKLSSWSHVGAETFGGEMCDVVESAQRAERLWIGQSSRRLRGVLSYRFTGFAGHNEFYQSETVQRIAGQKFASAADYFSWYRSGANENQLQRILFAWNERCAAEFHANARPNELIRFDDHRDIQPGVSVPLREIRTVPYPSETTKGKWLLRRTELVVDEVRTDFDLAEHYAELLPKEGDRVQDQRFAVPIDLQHSASRTDEETRQLADVQYQERLKGREFLKQLVKPIDAMIGKPATVLPDTGWLGGPRPALDGKPYLLHFWATWCGPCKDDLPRLKSLAERGAIIVGMHPSGTSAEEVEKVIRDQQLNYPTFLAHDDGNDAGKSRIAGYAAGVFPYCILVDADGRVARHGSLSELLENAGAGSIIPSGKGVANR